MRGLHETMRKNGGYKPNGFTSVGGTLILVVKVSIHTAGRQNYTLV